MRNKNKNTFLEWVGFRSLFLSTQSLEIRNEFWIYDFIFSCVWVFFSRFTIASLQSNGKREPGVVFVSWLICTLLRISSWFNLAQSDELDMRRSWNEYYANNENRFQNRNEPQDLRIHRFEWLWSLQLILRMGANQRARRTVTSNNAHSCFYNNHFIANFHCSLRFSSIFQANRTATASNVNHMNYKTGHKFRRYVFILCAI